MYPRRKWIGGEEGVQFWVRLATKNRGLTGIAVYFSVKGFGDCFVLVVRGRQ
jgi:hypothetical protein